MYGGNARGKLSIPAVCVEIISGKRTSGYMYFTSFPAQGQQSCGCVEGEKSEGENTIGNIGNGKSYVKDTISVTGAKRGSLAQHIHDEMANHWEIAAHIEVYTTIQSNALPCNVQINSQGDLNVTNLL